MKQKIIERLNNYISQGIIECYLEILLSDYFSNTNHREEILQIFKSLKVEDIIGSYTVEGAKDFGVYSIEKLNIHFNFSLDNVESNFVMTCFIDNDDLDKRYYINPTIDFINYYEGDLDIQSNNTLSESIYDNNQKEYLDELFYKILDMMDFYKISESIYYELKSEYAELKVKEYQEFLGEKFKVSISLFNVFLYLDFINLETNNVIQHKILDNKVEYFNNN